ncbi:hypothetical protein RS030_172635 [Cryptosporidium xiaoi]|uniref:Uncharacterized protein n=1 Tax=Cryptosporidium xiaoi TaxID=659607 RepID=A0AAV9Y2Z1_9CRYT
MFLSTINKLREENRKSNSLIVINGGNTINNSSNKPSKQESGLEYKNGRNILCSCKPKNKATSEIGDDKPLKKGKQSKSEIRIKNNNNYVPSFQNIINSVSTYARKENSIGLNNKSRVVHISSKLIDSCYEDNQEDNKEKKRKKKGSHIGASSENSDHGIKLVRILCTKNNNLISNNPCNIDSIEYFEKNNETEDETIRNENISSKKRNQNKELTNNRNRVESCSKGKPKTRSKIETDAVENSLNGDKSKSLKNKVNGDSLPTYKMRISSFKVKNSLIKKKYKDETNVNFFENLVLSTPKNNNSNIKMTGLENDSSHKRLSLITPVITEVENMKTGLTPVNNKTEAEFCDKLSKKKEQSKVGCVELFDLSPIGNSINGKKHYIDEGNSKSSSKNSVKKVIGDILSGLDTNRFKGKLKQSKLNCEKQNKFMAQLHEKLTSDENNGSTKHKINNSLISNLTSNTVITKQITATLENALERQSGINKNLKNQEDRQELIWNINEDRTLHPEEKNLLIQELMSGREE